MKKYIFVCIAILFLVSLSAQEQNYTLDWDIDTIFDEPEQETSSIEQENEKPVITVDKLIKQTGITFNVSYEFTAGIAPGWHESPFFPSDDYGYYLDRFIRLNSFLTADAQIDESLRIKTVLGFEIPNFRLILGDFFFDYNIKEVIFFRGGKYNHSWGIASNYNFTNLLARVPNDSVTGDSFIFKVDIPAGIGGFQFLTQTRADLMKSNPALPKLEDFGFGGKYNLAFSRADIDTGVYYQENMPLRSFLSIKTTLWKTDFYSEGLAAFNVTDPYEVSGAASFGIIKDFFGNKLNVNGEIFYNAEKDSYIYTPETNIREAQSSLFNEGWNLALNVLYRAGGKINFRLFTQMRYALSEDSMLLIPGFRISPLPHIDLYMAVPMALGSREGYYYSNTYTVDDKSRPIPFCVILMLSLSGNIQF
jgi:hypothetical protein